MQCETLPLENAGGILCHHDYTTRLPMEFDNLPMSDGKSGSILLVGMEGMVVKFKDFTMDRLGLHWFGWLLDEKQQDARTLFANTARLIEKMQTLNCLQPDEDKVLCIVSDRCARQYKCTDTLQIYMYLADGFRIPINIMFTAPYHGRSLVKAQAGLDKSLLKRKLLLVGFDHGQQRQPNLTGRSMCSHFVCY